MPSRPNIRSTTTSMGEQFYSILVSLQAPATPNTNICEACSAMTQSLYSCKDCFHSRLQCSECLCLAHKQNPYHRIQHWDKKKGCYVPTTLAEQGLILTLDHADGTCCPSKMRIRNLVVIHSNGIHKIMISQCDCTLEELRRGSISPMQLLTNKLFPATFDKPSTAFTFEALDQYDALNLESYINIKQYCDTMCALGGESLLGEV